MKGRIFFCLPVLFLFSLSAHAEVTASEAAGVISARILYIPFLAFLIWQVVRHFNKKAAYKKQLEERRRLREAHAEEDRQRQRDAQQPRGE
jgi:hypothetical protein